MKSILLSLLFCLPFLGTAQTVISGTVSDEAGNPLPYATIRVVDSYLGTIADFEGAYTLTVKGEKPTLKVSYLGYEDKLLQVVGLGNDVTVDVTMKVGVIEKAAVVISGTRATAKTPVAFNNLSGEEIEENNLGQDLPMMLNAMPSVVVSSDAGAGVGYTDMRIRGSDMTRINVTINGVPLNDAESQGVFWVNMPDFASSLENIQVQRGVGTSTNGGSAFGASVNLQTAAARDSAFAEANISFGSFNTQKYNLNFGSGLLSGKWSLDGRLSNISSDGYIDRATSDLQSYYLSGNYYGEKTTVNLVHFSGKERTYQSWYGSPEAALTGNEADKLEYILSEGLSSADSLNLMTSDRRFNFYRYENEVDNYQQDHYQAHLTTAIKPNLKATAALHYTKGAGYFEQFRENDDLADYGVANPVIGGDTVSTSDIVRRRWLDNDFVGGVFSLQYVKSKVALVVGGGYNEYYNDHFGEIIWAEFGSTSELRERYYDNKSTKTDGNAYAKMNFQATNKINLFADLQYRMVHYETAGIDNDLRTIDINEDFGFFNPKAGVNVQFNNINRLYASVAVGNREPSRTAFLDAVTDVKPVAESLIDYELGYQRNTSKYAFAANLYYMDYTNQLVITGELNDVGSSVKTNVAKSYRTGIELQWAWKIVDKLTWSANYTYSQNKIKDFTGIAYDYTNGFEIVATEYKNTNIALSPEHVASSTIQYSICDGLDLAFISKYVGEQYLDNTSRENRTIDAFLVNDVRIAYSPKQKMFDNVQLTLLVNNIAGTEYASKGYTYSYTYQEEYVRNHYYPQATTNFLLGLKVAF